MASFDFSTEDSMKKTTKLSESSLQRVTPDSGIALNYQSSVSSVGSLSPPIEKAAGEEMSKTFQSYDGGVQVSVPDMQDLHKKSSPLPPPVSDHLGPSRLSTYSHSAGNSPSSSPNTPTISGKGTIPLSHAPGNMNGSLMYGTSQMGSPVGSAGPMIHSSPLTNSMNTAFPFNHSYTNGLHHHTHNPHHHSSSSSSSFHHHQPYVMSHHQSPAAMFSPGNAYTRSPYGSTAPFPQYIQHQGSVQQQYRSYPQSPIARNNYQHQHYNSNGSISSSSPVSAFSTKPANNMVPPALIPNTSSPVILGNQQQQQQHNPTSPNLGISATTPTKHIESQGELDEEVVKEDEASSIPPLVMKQEDDYTVSSPPPTIEAIQPVIKEERQEEHQFFTKR